MNLQQDSSQQISTMTQSQRPKQSTTGAWLPIALCVLLANGCGVQDAVELSSTVQKLQEQQQRDSVQLTSIANQDESQESDDSIEALEPVAKFEPPYPNRVNPFLFQIDVGLDSPRSGGQSASDIKLYGFIGTESPKAIINASGQTRILAVGDQWGVLEITAIEPPEVRIRMDGVVRSWSLLGRTEQGP